jgi:glycosyltransferase involved in cell wall biosynthesis
MTANPLLTIGITAYNAENTIERAVRSALAQDYPSVEIVVVDDGSRDGTVVTLERLAATHPQLKLLVQPRNAGVAAARNRIIAEARGAFIAFFDDDDASEPDRTSRQISRLLAQEAALGSTALVVCHTARTQLYPDGTRRTEPALGEGSQAPTGPAVARRVLIGAPLADAYGSCATCSQLARTATYRSLGGFDPALRRSEDLDFAIRLARAGGHFVGIAAPLVTQTMTNTSDKSLADEERWQLAVIDKHRDFFESDDAFHFCRDWVGLRYAWIGGYRLRFATRLIGLAARRPWQTAQRLLLALPNLAGNRALGRLHRSGAGRPAASP